LVRPPSGMLRELILRSVLRLPCGACMFKEARSERSLESRTPTGSLGLLFVTVAWPGSDPSPSRARGRIRNWSRPQSSLRGRANCSARRRCKLALFALTSTAGWTADSEYLLGVEFFFHTGGMMAPDPSAGMVNFEQLWFSQKIH
jgi:hypothetical protein